MKTNRKPVVIICVTIRLAGWWSALAGRNGGSVIYPGRTGLIWRNMHRGKNPSSPAQVGVRAAFKQNSKGWAMLTTAEIMSWNKAAAEISKKNKVGTTYKGSGSAYYGAVNDTGNYINTCAAMSSITPPITLPIVNPPAAASLNVFTGWGNLVAKNVSGTQTMTVDLPQIATGTALIIYAIPTQSNGKSNFKGQYRPIAYYPSGAAALATNILAQYQNEFGDLVAGKKVSVKGRVVGLTSVSPAKSWIGEDLTVQIAAS